MNGSFANFRQCLAASVLLHAAFFLIARRLPTLPAKNSVEVEITSPFLGTGPAKLGAPKAKTAGAKGIPLPAETVKPTEPQKPIEPPKEWVAPSPEVHAVEKLS